MQGWPCTYCNLTHNLSYIFVFLYFQFYFINNFYSLFHIAFVLQDMDLLKTVSAAYRCSYL